MVEHQNPPWLDEVYAQVDAEIADIRWRERQRAQTAQVKKQHGGLIYKNCERAPVQEQSAKQPTVMDPEQQEPWDRWADSRIARALEEQHEPLAEAVAEFVSEYFHRRFAEEKKALGEEIMSEIGALRADFTIDRTHRGQQVIALPKVRLKGCA